MFSTLFCYSDGFDQAKAVAAKSDVVVVVLGLAFDQYCMDMCHVECGFYANKPAGNLFFAL